MDLTYLHFIKSLTVTNLKFRLQYNLFFMINIILIHCLMILDKNQMFVVLINKRFFPSWRSPLKRRLFFSQAAAIEFSCIFKSVFWEAKQDKKQVGQINSWEVSPPVEIRNWTNLTCERRGQEGGGAKNTSDNLTRNYHSPTPIPILTWI